MVKINIKINTNKIETIAKKSANIRQLTERVVKLIHSQTINHIKKGQLEKPKYRKGKALFDTGAFVNTIYWTLTSDTTGYVGSDWIGAGVHQYGAVIKGRPWLTIPVNEMAYRKSIRDFDEVSGKKCFFFTSKKGNLLFGYALNKDNIIPLFVLKKEVKIPARPYLDSFNEDTYQQLKVVENWLK